jgi:hypothetical protein
MHTRDPLVCRSLSKSHNFLFGSSTNTTCFNYANTCSLNSASSLTSLVYESWGWPSGLDQREENMGLIYYYEDGDGDAMTMATFWREKGLDKGGRGGMEGWVVFINCFHFHIQNFCCENWQRWRGGRRRIWFEFTIWAFYFFDQHIVSCCVILLLFLLFLPFQCRSTDFTSSSSQLLDGYLLQDFSSSPNLVITFLFGNIVWELTVANNCIGHWHKTGLRAF